MRWIVDYTDRALRTFADLPPKAARRAMRLVREFAAHPGDVEFEIIASYYLFLYAADLPGWRVQVELDEPVIRVVGVSKYKPSET